MLYSYKIYYYDWDILRYDDDNWGIDVSFVLIIILYLIISTISFTNWIIIHYLDHYYYINFIYVDKDIYLFYNYEII
jgi:hypothetical protein